jgi:pimeloyl-ACP methyl ester carboxylesterase
LGTLIVNLLTTAESSVDAQTGQLSADVELLSARLVGIVDWLSAEPATEALPIGVLASGTAAAAALAVAAMRIDQVHAVVSRGGRPDRADQVLWGVHAPTLLIVGRRDLLGVARNRYALERMTCARKLVLLEGVGQAFPSGAPEDAARVATQWFQGHLIAKPAALVGAAGSDEDDCC